MTRLSQSILGCAAVLILGLASVLNARPAQAEMQSARAVSQVDAPASDDARIHVLEIRGVINPLTASYLQRALAEAEEGGAGLVVLLLDTPGGLDTAMREMTQALLASRVPVAVYVAPSGARAASAGMFITLAAHLAAMAPGTNIGAAHPVSLGQQGEPDAVMATKAAQDAAATARALAVERGRDPTWAERAVLESISLTNGEALEHRLIDLIAVDLDDLLVQLDGRAVKTAAGTATLRTREAARVYAPMNLVESLLHHITDPNIALLLLTLGLYGLIIEFQAPGFGLPGAVGVISLALAFVAFGSLPLNWAGVGLIGLGVILLLVEAASPGFGATGAAGLAMFALGALMLYRPFTAPSPTLPAVTVNPWLVAALTIGSGALLLLGVGKGLAAQRAPAVSDVPRRLVGAVGVARSDLDPVGAAQVESELWTAAAEGAEPIRAGDKILVIAVEGIQLRVRRAAERPPAPNGG